MEYGESGAAGDADWELGAAIGQYLLAYARRTLNEFLAEGVIRPIESDDPRLLRPRAVFVTLWRHDTGDLRGCRGEPRPQRPLIEAVALMTIAAAIDDPRFPPVRAEELPLLQIEINLLTTPRTIHPREIEIGRHGLLLECSGGGGLLLPEVAPRHGLDPNGLLKALCAKAHVPDGAWLDPQCRLYAFESLTLLEVSPSPAAL